MANNIAAKICSLLSQIRVHVNIIIIQITSIKYDITLTTLSFFIFSNVLSHDITKNPVKFCFSSQIFLKNFQNKRWRQSILWYVLLPKNGIYNHGCNHLTSIKRKACFENFNHYILTTNGKYRKTLVSLIIKMELNYINIIYNILYIL